MFYNNIHLAYLLCALWLSRAALLKHTKSDFIFKYFGQINEIIINVL